MKRFDVYVCDLDPTVGAEMRKQRPVVVISPSALQALRTVIMAPMTSTQKGWAFRVPVTFRSVAGEIALDQIRCVDKVRLIRRVGTIDKRTSEKVCETLREMFSFQGAP